MVFSPGDGYEIAATAARAASRHSAPRRLPPALARAVLGLLRDELSCACLLSLSPRGPRAGIGRERYQHVPVGRGVLRDDHHVADLERPMCIVPSGRRCQLVVAVAVERDMSFSDRLDSECLSSMHGSSPSTGARVLPSIRAAADEAF